MVGARIFAFKRPQTISEIYDFWWGTFKIRPLRLGKQLGVLSCFIG